MDFHRVSVASQGHAEHAEEFDKKTKNTPKIEVFGNFPPFLPQFGQNTPDFSIFLPLCDAPAFGGVLHYFILQIIKQFALF